MLRSFRSLLPLLLLASAAAGAQNPGIAPDATKPADDSQVTVTAPRPDKTLPPLKPDEFTNCMQQIGLDTLERGNVSEFAMQASICEHQLAYEKHVVIEACINRDGKNTPPRIIQACTESLDHKILQGDMQFYIYENRAAAYFAFGDRQRALADYDAAVKLAPKNADLYYNRGVFYAAQPDDEAALRDFNAALGINARLVPALRQRAKIYQARGNFDGALADYSQAITLEPNTALLWAERGYVSLRHPDYDASIKDEAEAIRLDPKLARAWFFRGAAFGGVGNKEGAINDLKQAVSLDPSLDQYVVSNGKTAFLKLPPL